MFNSKALRRVPIAGVVIIAASFAPPALAMHAAHGGSPHGARHGSPIAINRDDIPAAVRALLE